MGGNELLFLVSFCIVGGVVVFKAYRIAGERRERLAAQCLAAQSVEDGLAHAGNSLSTPAFYDFLCAQTFWALFERGTKNGPLSFAWSAPADRKNPEPDQLIEAGPDLICFASMLSANTFFGGTVLGQILSRNYSLERVPARSIFERALDTGVPVVVNPGGPAKFRFEDQALRQILKVGST